MPCPICGCETGHNKLMTGLRSIIYNIEVPAPAMSVLLLRRFLRTTFIRHEDFKMPKSLVSLYVYKINRVFRDFDIPYIIVALPKIGYKLEQVRGEAQTAEHQENLHP